MKPISKRSGLLVLAGGLVMMAVGPLLIPVRQLKGTYPAHDLADSDSEFITLNELDIHIKRMGQGEPTLVLLHGFASSLYTWQFVMEALSRIGNVIAFDRPGFGLSERPLAWEGENPYSFAAQVDLVLALLDHFGVQRAILVGNSAGGSIAMQVALSHPERVSALILADPAVYHGGGAPGWVRPILSTPQMRHLGPLLTRQVLARGRDLLKLAWHEPANMPPELTDSYLKPFKVENWDKSLWEFSLSSQSTRLSERLDELNLPCLVITGDDDRIVPTKDSLRLARELPNASLIVVENAGHVPHEEKPQQFMEAVTNFMNDLHAKE
jgi:pimeloyl-ACP methyl ester carboxylesterase